MGIWLKDNFEFTNVNNYVDKKPECVEK